MHNHIKRLNQKHKRKSQTITVIMLLCLSSLMACFPESNAGTAWISGWNYRVPITINATIGAGSDYQQAITLHYGSGSNNATDYYLDNFATDIIQFAASDGLTLLPCWNQTYSYHNLTKWWFKVADNINTTSATVYLYYGNSTYKTNPSNLTDTFTVINGVIGAWMLDETQIGETGYVVCLGDSITAGVATPSYPTLLSRLRGSAVVNDGHGGYTTGQLLSIAQAYNSSLGYHTLVAMAGANDVYSFNATTTEANLLAIWQAGLALDMTVYALTVTPHVGYDTEIQTINTWIKATAPTYNITVIDTYALMDDPSSPGQLNPIYDNGDNLHLNAAGNLVIAQAVWDAMGQPCYDVKDYSGQDNNGLSGNVTIIDSPVYAGKKARQFHGTSDGVINFTKSLDISSGWTLLVRFSRSGANGGTGTSHGLVKMVTGDQYARLGTGAIGNNFAQQVARTTGTPEWYGAQQTVADDSDSHLYGSQYDLDAKVLRAIGDSSIGSNVTHTGDLYSGSNALVLGQKSTTEGFANGTMDYVLAFNNSNIPQTQIELIYTYYPDPALIEGSVCIRTYVETAPVLTYGSVENSLPTPTPQYLVAANNAVTNCYVALGLVSTSLLILSTVIILSAVRSDGGSSKSMFLGVTVLIGTFVMLIVGVALINGFAASIGV